jgi:acetyl-CoA C-acetyltransferase
MESIKDRVAIIGMGCSKFGERWDMGTEDLLVESCYEAFADAGIESKDIQAAWFGTQNQMSGQVLAHAIKTEYIPITRIENFCATGTNAMMDACYAVAAGVYDMVLVAGVEKLKDSGVGFLTGGGGQPSAGTGAAAPPPAQFALAANRYFHQYGLSYDEGKRLLSLIDVKNHHNGSLNPKAHFQKEITLEQAINAPMQAYPLGLYDCCGVSDGSAAAVITTPERAKSFKDDYVLVKGLGLAVGGQQGMLRDYYDFTHFDETVHASKMAYESAGITNPREEVSLAEVHDCFSITELIIYEDMGWSPRGGAKEDIESGFFDIDGGLPVQTDGGLKCFGHPIGASGLRMIYEMYKQLQGKADQRQLKDPKLGLTHNLGGQPPHCTMFCGIFGKELG